MPSHNSPARTKDRREPALQPDEEAVDKEPTATIFRVDRLGLVVDHEQGVGALHGAAKAKEGIALGAMIVYTRRKIAGRLAYSRQGYFR